MAHLLIIGGSDAGTSAALRVKEVDPTVDVTVVVADAFPNYSICGLPYYLSGEVLDWRDLSHRTVGQIERTGIRLLLNRTAQTVDPVSKVVMVTDQEGHAHRLQYDRLVIATGAVPVQPDVESLDLPGVFSCVRWATAWPSTSI